jgi:hypothetical protein
LESFSSAVHGARSSGGAGSTAAGGLLKVPAGGPGLSPDDSPAAAPLDMRQLMQRLMCLELSECLELRTIMSTGGKGMDLVEGVGGTEPEITGYEPGLRGQKTIRCVRWNGMLDRLVFQR